MAYTVVLVLYIIEPCSLIINKIINNIHYKWNERGNDMSKRMENENVVDGKFDFTYVLNLFIMNKFNTDSAVELQVILKALLDAYPEGFNRDTVEKIYSELFDNDCAILRNNMLYIIS